MFCPPVPQFLQKMKTAKFSHESSRSVQLNMISKPSNGNIKHCLRAATINQYSPQIWHSLLFPSLRNWESLRPWETGQENFLNHQYLSRVLYFDVEIW